MTLTFISVSLKDKTAILFWCVRWLFKTKATLMIPNSMVFHTSSLEPSDNNDLGET